jgi:hypothetical protein
MLLIDVLEQNIEVSLEKSGSEMAIVFEVPSEDLILKNIGDSEGKPTKSSDDMLLKTRFESGVRPDQLAERLKKALEIDVRDRPNCSGIRQVARPRKPVVNTVTQELFTTI